MVKVQTEYAVEVSNLTKKYGDLVAVDHVNFSVRKGEIFGFLGPNGAGKTTRGTDAYYFDFNNFQSVHL